MKNKSDMSIPNRKEKIIKKKFVSQDYSKEKEDRNTANRRNEWGILKNILFTALSLSILCGVKYVFIGDSRAEDIFDLVDQQVPWDPINIYLNYSTTYMNDRIQGSGAWANRAKEYIEMLHAVSKNNRTLDLLDSFLTYHRGSGSWSGSTALMQQGALPSSMHAWYMNVAELLQLINPKVTKTISSNTVLDSVRLLQFAETSRHIEAFYLNLPYSAHEMADLYFTNSPRLCVLYDQYQNVVASYDRHQSKFSYYGFNRRQYNGFISHLKRSYNSLIKLIFLESTPDGKWPDTEYATNPMSHSPSSADKWLLNLSTINKKFFSKEFLLTKKFNEMKKFNLDPHDKKTWKKYYFKAFQFKNPYVLKWGQISFFNKNIIKRRRFNNKFLNPAHILLNEKRQTSPRFFNFIKSFVSELGSFSKDINRTHFYDKSGVLSTNLSINPQNVNWPDSWQKDLHIGDYRLFNLNKHNRNAPERGKFQMFKHWINNPNVSMKKNVGTYRELSWQPFLGKNLTGSVKQIWDMHYWDPNPFLYIFTKVSKHMHKALRLIPEGFSTSTKRYSPKYYDPKEVLTFLGGSSYWLNSVDLLSNLNRLNFQTLLDSEFGDYDFKTKLSNNSIHLINRKVIFKELFSKLMSSNELDEQTLIAFINHLTWFKKLEAVSKNDSSKPWLSWNFFSTGNNAGFIQKNFSSGPFIELSDLEQLIDFKGEFKKQNILNLLTSANRFIVDNDYYFDQKNENAWKLEENLENLTKKDLLLVNELYNMYLQRMGGVWRESSPDPKVYNPLLLVFKTQEELEYLSFVNEHIAPAKKYLEKNFNAKRWHHFRVVSYLAKLSKYSKDITFELTTFSRINLYNKCQVHIEAKKKIENEELTFEERDDWEWIRNYYLHYNPSRLVYYWEQHRKEKYDHKKHYRWLDRYLRYVQIKDFAFNYVEKLPRAYDEKNWGCMPRRMTHPGWNFSDGIWGLRTWHNDNMRFRAFSYPSYAPYYKRHATPMHLHNDWKINWDSYYRFVYKGRQPDRFLVAKFNKLFNDRLGIIRENASDRERALVHNSFHLFSYDFDNKFYNDLPNRLIGSRIIHLTESELNAQIKREMKLWTKNFTVGQLAKRFAQNMLHIKHNAIPEYSAIGRHSPYFFPLFGKHQYGQLPRVNFLIGSLIGQYKPDRKNFLRRKKRFLIRKRHTNQGKTMHTPQKNVLNAYQRFRGLSENITTKLLETFNLKGKNLSLNSRGFRRKLKNKNFAKMKWSLLQSIDQLRKFKQRLIGVGYTFNEDYNIIRPIQQFIIPTRPSSISRKKPKTTGLLRLRNIIPFKSRVKESFSAILKRRTRKYYRSRIKNIGKKVGGVYRTKQRQYKPIRFIKKRFIKRFKKAKTKVRMPMSGLRAMTGRQYGSNHESLIAKLVTWNNNNHRLDNPSNQGLPEVNTRFATEIWDKWTFNLMNRVQGRRYVTGWDYSQASSPYSTNYDYFDYYPTRSGNIRYMFDYSSVNDIYPFYRSGYMPKVDEVEILKSEIEEFERTQSQIDKEIQHHQIPHLSEKLQEKVEILKSEIEEETREFLLENSAKDTAEYIRGHYNDYVDYMNNYDSIKGVLKNDFLSDMHKKENYLREDPLSNSIKYRIRMERDQPKKYSVKDRYSALYRTQRHLRRDLTEKEIFRIWVAGANNSQIFLNRRGNEKHFLCESDLLQNELQKFLHFKDKRELQSYLPFSAYDTLDLPLSQKLKYYWKGLSTTPGFILDWHLKQKQQLLEPTHFSERHLWTFNKMQRDTIDPFLKDTHKYIWNSNKKNIIRIWQDPKRKMPFVGYFGGYGQNKYLEIEPIYWRANTWELLKLNRTFEVTSLFNDVTDHLSSRIAKQRARGDFIKSFVDSESYQWPLSPTTALTMRNRAVVAQFEPRGHFLDNTTEEYSDIKPASYYTQSYIPLDLDDGEEETGFFWDGTYYPIRTNESFLEGYIALPWEWEVAGGLAKKLVSSAENQLPYKELCLARYGDLPGSKALIDGRLYSLHSGQDYTYGRVQKALLNNLTYNDTGVIYDVDDNYNYLLEANYKSDYYKEFLKQILRKHSSWTWDENPYEKHNQFAPFIKKYLKLSPEKKILSRRKNENPSKFFERRLQFVKETLSRRKNENIFKFLKRRLQFAKRTAKEDEIYYRKIKPFLDEKGPYQDRYGLEMLDVIRNIVSSGKEITIKDDFKSCIPFSVTGAEEFLTAGEAVAKDRGLSFLFLNFLKDDYIKINNCYEKSQDEIDCVKKLLPSQNKWKLRKLLRTTISGERVRKFLKNIAIWKLRTRWLHNYNIIFWWKEEELYFATDIAQSVHYAPEQTEDMDISFKEMMRMLKLKKDDVYKYHQLWYDWIDFQIEDADKLDMLIEDKDYKCWTAELADLRFTPIDPYIPTAWKRNPFRSIGMAHNYFSPLIVNHRYIYCVRSQKQYKAWLSECAEFKKRRKEEPDYVPIKPSEEESAFLPIEDQNPWWETLYFLRKPVYTGDSESDSKMRHKRAVQRNKLALSNWEMQEVLNIYTAQSGFTELRSKSPYDLAYHWEKYEKNTDNIINWLEVQKRDHGLGEHLWFLDPINYQAGETIFNNNLNKNNNVRLPKNFKKFKKFADSQMVQIHRSNYFSPPEPYYFLPNFDPKEVEKSFRINKVDHPILGFFKRKWWIDPLFTEKLRYNYFIKIMQLTEKSGANQNWPNNSSNYFEIKPVNSFKKEIESTYNSEVDDWNSTYVSRRLNKESAKIQLELAHSAELELAKQLIYQTTKKDNYFSFLEMDDFMNARSYWSEKIPREWEEYVVKDLYQGKFNDLTSVSSWKLPEYIEEPDYIDEEIQKLLFSLSYNKDTILIPVNNVLLDLLSVRQLRTILRKPDGSSYLKKLNAIFCNAYNLKVDDGNSTYVPWRLNKESAKIRLENLGNQFLGFKNVRLGLIDSRVPIDEGWMPNLNFNQEIILRNKYRECFYAPFSYLTTSVLKGLSNKSRHSSYYLDEETRRLYGIWNVFICDFLLKKENLFTENQVHKDMDVYEDHYEYNLELAKQNKWKILNSTFWNTQNNPLNTSLLNIYTNNIFPENIEWHSWEAFDEWRTDNESFCYFNMLDWGSYEAEDLNHYLTGLPEHYQPILKMNKISKSLNFISTLNSFWHCHFPNENEVRRPTRSSNRPYLSNLIWFNRIDPLRLIYAGSFRNTADTFSKLNILDKLPYNDLMKVMSIQAKILNPYKTLAKTDSFMKRFWKRVINRNSRVALSGAKYDTFQDYLLDTRFLQELEPSTYREGDFDFLEGDFEPSDFSEAEFWENKPTGFYTQENIIYSLPQLLYRQKELYDTRSYTSQGGLKSVKVANRTAYLNYLNIKSSIREDPFHSWWPYLVPNIKQISDISQFMNSNQAFNDLFLIFFDTSKTLDSHFRNRSILKKFFEILYKQKLLFPFNESKRGKELWLTEYQFIHKFLNVKRAGCSHPWWIISNEEKDTYYKQNLTFLEPRSLIVKYITDMMFVKNEFLNRKNLPLYYTKERNKVATSELLTLVSSFYADRIYFHNRWTTKTKLNKEWWSLYSFLTITEELQGRISDEKEYDFESYAYWLAQIYTNGKMKDPHEK